MYAGVHTPPGVRCHSVLATHGCEFLGSSRGGDGAVGTEVAVANEGKARAQQVVEHRHLPLDCDIWYGLRRISRRKALRWLKASCETVTVFSIFTVMTTPGSPFSGG
eukprot:8100326-Lingulodinium_polyedra.AAC.1